MEIIRKRYLDILSSAKDKTDLVKVITGIRRTGKSTVLRQFASLLKKTGIDENNLMIINMDLIQKELDHSELSEMISPMFENTGIHYVMIDEIQNVEQWERTVAMLVARGDCDVYITGSNSKMLSTELSTRLTGRYMEMEVFPLSFGEYIELHPGDRTERFNEYLRYGALPAVEPERGYEICRRQLSDIYGSIMINDVLRHIKSNDANALMSVARFLYSNVGNVTNVYNISKALNLNHATVDKYITELISARLFRHAERFDIVGKKILNTKGKYYATDLGLREVSIGGAGVTDVSRPIENLVYMELLRRGYTVRSGSFRDREIDFTAFRDGRIEYYQVTLTMLSEETKERELSGLRRIDDNYRKTVLTLDRIGLGSYGGIEVMNILDWLLDAEDR